MRRRSKSNKIELELFPFLSVLACTIGSLILLIIVLSTETLKENPEVTIIAKTEAGGVNRKKQPRYIECKEDGIVIYPSQEFVPKNELTKPNSKLANFITEIKQNREKEYVIVAVRPNGIDVFQKVRELIEKEEIDIGYEPIEEGWKLKIQ
jgi:biopolymer transport protein ExbD